jgi:hypothetical protein
MSAYREGEGGERIAELERALGDAKRYGSTLERALWAARRRAKARRALGFASAVGLGSLGGTLAGAGAWAATGNPTWLWVGTVVASLGGAILEGLWNDPGKFPDAPEERLQRPPPG